MKDGEDVVPLRDYFEAQFMALERANEAKTKELDRRLEELNQLRDEVVTDRQRFMPRDVYDEGHRSLMAKVEQLEHGDAERREQLRIDLQRQIDDLKRRSAIMVGVGLVLVPLAGLIGAAIAKSFGF